MAPTPSNRPRVALLGTGKLGEALFEGLARARVLDAVIATARRAERRSELASRFAVRVTSDNRAAVEGAELVLLGVRGPEIPALLEEIRPALAPRACVISLAAGVPLAALEPAIPEPVSVIRALANTPIAVGAGVVALAGSVRAESDVVDRARAFFAPLGTVAVIAEAQLDAVNALCGAGPAFVFRFIQALAGAAATEGIEPVLADAMARAMVRGAAELALASPAAMAELIQQVASPGGATAAGLEALEARQLAEAVGAAIHSAAENARARSRAALQTEGARAGSGAGREGQSA